jgi:DNA repair exonuclease SbcCD nuclease subunit
VEHDVSETIRIAHISDTHLGYRSLGKVDKTSGRNQRTVDVDLAFERAIDDILRQKVDAVIHGGDVFHYSRPTWQSLRHFIRQMRRLEDAGIPTVVIAGNHDTPRIRTGGSVYSVLDLALPHIRFVAEYEDVHEVEIFKHLNVHIHAVPHGALTNADPVITGIVPGKRNILICHGMVPGILGPGIHAEPGEQTLDAHLLDPEFDYVALGHYHVHMKAAPKAWYSGSTERYGWGDHDVAPGYAIIELDEPQSEARVEHRGLPSRPMHSLKPISGNGLQARDIADRALEQLHRLQTPDAMTRVELRDVDRTIRRETERILRREAEEYVWSCVVIPERIAFMPSTELAPAHELATDLQTLFAEFVTSRTGTHFTTEFAQRLLDRGGRALTDAAIAEAAPTPEDNGDA